jgi:hypothetical protein
MAASAIIVPIFARTSHVSAQSGTVVADGGPACPSGAQTVALGFSYYVRFNGANGANNAAASGTYVARDNPLPDEPYIANVESNGPNAGRVQQGDRIARVNGYPVTTAEGTAALRNARPGSALVLTIRRGDKLLPVAITPSGWRCSAPTNALTITPSVIASTVPGYALAARSDVAPLRIADAATVRDGRTVTLMGTMLPSVSNPGWLGMGFDCASCGQRATPAGRVWYFSEPPVIYNVDTGSPAYNAGIRRGDVLLRIDGKDVKSPAAGARLGLVKPGETLRLTYRRDAKTRDASLKVATSPLVQRGATALRSADQLLKSTQELRLSTNESSVRSLMSEMERARAVEKKNLDQLERALRQNAGSTEARAVFNKLRAAQQSRAAREQKVLREMLATEKEGSRQLDLVEAQVAHATVSIQPYMYTLDSVATGRVLPRDQKLRYSGSIGDADVEVRGPGSVSVQGDNDDIVIVTGDAVIRIKSRKVRDRND